MAEGEGFDRRRHRFPESRFFEDLASRTGAATPRQKLRAFAAACKTVWRTFRQLFWPKKPAVSEDDWKRWT